MSRIVIHALPATSAATEGLRMHKLVGNDFGNWRIVEYLGETPNGHLFRVRHLFGAIDNRELVLVANADRERLEWFVATAKTWKDFGHVHLVKIIDFGATATHLYYIRAPINGPTLAAYVADLARPRRLPIAVGFVYQAALAVAYAQEHGVLLRALDPTNIHVVLTDPSKPAVVVSAIEFSRRPDAPRSDATIAGFAPTLTIYASPEELNHQITETSAVYTLSLILIFIFNQRPPYRDLAERHKSPNHDKLLSRLPDRLQSILARALSADPTARPSPAEFAKQLVGYLRAATWRTVHTSPAPRAATTAVQQRVPEKITRATTLPSPSERPAEPKNAPALEGLKAAAVNAPPRDGKVARRRRLPWFIWPVAILAAVAGGLCAAFFEQRDAQTRRRINCADLTLELDQAIYDRAWLQANLLCRDVLRLYATEPALTQKCRHVASEHQAASLHAILGTVAKSDGCALVLSIDRRIAADSVYHHEAQIAVGECLSRVLDENCRMGSTTCGDILRQAYEVLSVDPANQPAQLIVAEQSECRCVDERSSTCTGEKNLTTPPPSRRSYDYRRSWR